MRFKGNIAKYAVVGFFGFGAAIVGWNALQSTRSADRATVAVAVPDLSPAARAGKNLFDANCATCHGANGGGSDRGPPLVHDIYNPGHHADEAFVLAAKLGVRRHHWRFGDMPPQPQVTDEQVRAITDYIRELQRANGISYRPHRM